jgi:ubiquinone/menaquinone biosynthesis C-methylase UbiE
MNQQKEIVNWFNKTYSQHGELYLRPKQAYSIFLKMLAAKPNEKLLDVACGLGRVIEVGLEKGIEVSGIDISDVAVEKCQKKFPNNEVLVANAEELPFSEKQFEYITCLGSLERMLNREKVVEEMKRVLKEHGKICFLVRNSESWFWKFIQKPLGFVNRKGHQDALSLDEWSSFLEKQGLKITSVYKDQWPLMQWKRWFSFGFWNGYEKIHHGFIPVKYAYEFIFICEKR